MSFRKVKDAEMFDAKELPVYGMDLELEKKRNAKKNSELEQSVKDWIKSTTGTDISQQDFADAFADGILLCKFGNQIFLSFFFYLNCLD